MTDKALCDEKHKRVDEIMDEIKDTQETQGKRIDGLATEVQGMAKEVAILSNRVDDLPGKITIAVRAALPAPVRTEWTPKGIVAMVVKLWPYILLLLGAAGLGYGISPTAPAAPAAQVEPGPAEVPE